MSDHSASDAEQFESRYTLELSHRPSTVATIVKGYLTGDRLKRAMVKLELEKHHRYEALVLKLGSDWDGAYALFKKVLKKLEQSNYTTTELASLVTSAVVSADSMILAVASMAILTFKHFLSDHPMVAMDPDTMTLHVPAIIAMVIEALYQAHYQGTKGFNGSTAFASALLSSSLRNIDGKSPKEVELERGLREISSLLRNIDGRSPKEVDFEPNPHEITEAVGWLSFELDDDKNMMCEANKMICELEEAKAKAESEVSVLRLTHEEQEKAEKKRYDQEMTAVKTRMRMAEARVEASEAKIAGLEGDVDALEGECSRVSMKKRKV